MYTSRHRLLGKSVSVLTMVAVGFSALVLPFTYAAMVHAVSAPTITSISPTSGPSSGGTSVTISGTGFDTGATVKIGANFATSVSVVSSTTITAISPSGGVGLQDVVIDNPDTGNAILVEGFEYLAPSSSPEPVTLAASLITSTDATLNGKNGTSAATDSMFWVGTSTFSTGTTTLPAGVYSSGSLGARAADESFSLSLFAIDGLPTVTADTTYYFTVWTKVDGVWTAGDVLSFTTLSASGSVSPTTLAASGITSGGATLNAMNGTSAATGHMFWVATTTFSTASSTLPAGVHMTGNFGPLAADASFSTTLSAITSLYPVTADTTYYFAPWVEVDGEWVPGAVMSFTTSSSDPGSSSEEEGEISGEATGGTTPNGSLAVTSITVEDGTAVADGTFAHGWKYVFHVTVPADETNLAMKFGNWFNATASTSIAAANNIRISSAQADNGGATVLITAANTYSTPALHITGDLNASLPGKQVEIVVEAAVPTGTVNGSYTTTYGVQTLP